MYSILLTALSVAGLFSLVEAGSATLDIRSDIKNPACGKANTVFISSLEKSAGDVSDKCKELHDYVPGPWENDKNYEFIWTCGSVNDYEDPWLKNPDEKKNTKFVFVANERVPVDITKSGNQAPAGSLTIIHPDKKVVGKYSVKVDVNVNAGKKEQSWRYIYCN